MWFKTSVMQNLTVRFTGVRAMPPTFLDPLCEVIVAAGPGVPLEVGALQSIQKVWVDAGDQTRSARTACACNICTWE